MKSNWKKRSLMAVLAAGMLLLNSATVFAANTTNTACPYNPNCVRPASCQNGNQSCQNAGKQQIRQGNKAKQAANKNNKSNAKVTKKSTAKVIKKAPGSCGSTPKKDGSGQGKRGQGGRGNGIK